MANASLALPVTIIAHIIQQDKRINAKTDSDETVLAFRNRNPTHSNHNQSSYKTDGCFKCGRIGHRGNECRYDFSFCSIVLLF